MHQLRRFASKVILPNLRYDYGALEPVISGKIMELHHSKHHAAYVTNLNLNVEKSEEALHKGDIATVIALQQAIRFNGGGNLNHTVFFDNLAPISKGGGQPPKGALLNQINAQFGTLDKLIEKMNTAGLGVQGSGWVFLAQCKETKRLNVVTTPNQDPVFTAGATLNPVVAIDVWEHAYYLQHVNNRAGYLKDVWKVVDWAEAEKRFIA